MQKPVAFAAVFLYLPCTQLLSKRIQRRREISR
jgi:hypothetical protein